MIDVQDSIAPLIERMWARPDEHLSLSHAAALAGCDATTLSRRFKRKLGHSFRGVKVQLTLEKADKLFRESPTLRISEVAYQLGFEDPLYFSRFYRRHRGMPPTEAKRRILSEQRKRQGSRPKC